MAAIMPASLAAHYGRLGLLQVVPIALPLRVPSVHLITMRHRALSPVAQGFMLQLASGRYPCASPHASRRRGANRRGA
jgi:DNA-binding transcriptional LysR family regulator